MTAVNTLWGPAALGGWSVVGGIYALNDADDSAAFVFTIPKSGTITDVGIHCAAITGNPPAYNVGLVTVTASTGLPTTTAYGGSTNTTKDFTAAQWEWITLGAPATAVAGELAAVRVWPTGTAPDVSNSASIQQAYVMDYSHPRLLTYGVVWSIYHGMAQGYAVKYSDGSVYGLAITARDDGEIQSDTTPDETGAVFTLPAAMTCIGAHIGFSAIDPDAPFTVKLYDASNTLLASAVISDEDSVSGETASILVYWASPVNLAASVNYRLTVLSDSATLGVTPAQYMFESASSRSSNIMVPEAANWQTTERTDAGAWTETSAQCPHMGLIISDITFSTGVAAGGSWAHMG